MISWMYRLPFVLCEAILAAPYKVSEKMIMATIVIAIKPLCDRSDGTHQAKRRHMLIWAMLVMARPARNCLRLILSAQVYYQAVEETTHEEQDKYYCKIRIPGMQPFVKPLA